MRRLSPLVGLWVASFLFLGSCGSTPTQKVTASIHVTASHVDDDGNPLLDFGPVPVLLTKTLSITVTNLSRVPLTIEAVSLDAEDEVFTSSQEFEVVSLAGGESMDIPIVFRPTEQSPFSGTVTISSSDAQRKVVEVGMDGVGSTVGKVEIEPDSLDFGVVGEWTQEVRNVRLASVGSAPLLVESIELLEGTSEVFMILGSTQPTELPPPADGFPGGEVQISVACSPTSATEGETFEGMLKIVTTDPTKREVTIPLTAAVNRAPIALFEIDPSNHAANLPIALDGSESYDPDGDDAELTFQWRVFRQPLGTTATFDDETSPTPTLTVSASGEYEIGLDVWDGEGLKCYAPEGSDILPCVKLPLTIAAEDDLVITLVWNHSLTDLDLHLLDTDAELYSDGDCFWANQQPDFGVIDDPTDDPRFVRESLKGFGPEEILFSNPSGGTYTVVVDFSKANGSREPSTFAILRVYIYGKLEAEMRKTLEEPGQIWEALAIEWPSAVVTQIDELQEAVAK